MATNNADFKASPVCIAGTTCLGFGVTFTGVLAAKEAFHSNHKNDAASEPTLGGIGSGKGGPNQPCDTGWFTRKCLGGLQCDSSVRCVPYRKEGEDCDSGNFDCAGILTCCHGTCLAGHYVYGCPN